MLIGVAAVAAQAPSPIRPAVLIRQVGSGGGGGGFLDPARSLAAVVERLESFDANGDHLISRAELPERMQGLVARGDRNADAVLDSQEIRFLVTAASSERFGFSFSREPSEGLPGVVKDLRLPPVKQADALAIVSGHKLSPNFSDPAGNALFKEMKALLDPEEYENFVAAAMRVARRPIVIR
jgi:hypothetical protein